MLDFCVEYAHRQLVRNGGSGWDRLGCLLAELGVFQSDSRGYVVCKRVGGGVVECRRRGQLKPEEAGHRVAQLDSACEHDGSERQRQTREARTQSRRTS